MKPHFDGDRNWCLSAACSLIIWWFAYFYQYYYYFEVTFKFVSFAYLPIVVELDPVQWFNNNQRMWCLCDDIQFNGNASPCAAFSYIRYWQSVRLCKCLCARVNLHGSYVNKNTVQHSFCRRSQPYHSTAPHRASLSLIWFRTALLFVFPALLLLLLLFCCGRILSLNCPIAF